MADVLKVTDIYLRAYLSAEGYESTNTEVESRDGRKTVVFVYEQDSQELREPVREFRDSEFMRKFIKSYLSTKREITKVLRDDRYEY